MRTAILKIDPGCQLVTLQSEFHMAFPHLRLEFYHHPHGVYEGSPRKDIADPGLRVSDVGSREVSGTLTASPETRVRDFEKQLLEEFGLSAQVFRHSGGKWVQTTSSDDWTLGQQHLRGESSAVMYRHLTGKR